MTFRMNGNCITPVCAHMLFTRVSLSITIEDNLQLLTAIKTEHINASIIIQEILVSEATHEEGLELSLGQEGWLRLEAGSKICGSAHSQCKDFS